MQKTSKNLLAAAIIAGALSLASTPTLADSTAKPHGGQDCFFARDWQGWASPSPDIIYLRVRNKDIYRVDLTGGSSELQNGNVHLVTKFNGTDVVCTPLDLDLSVADSGGFCEPLIVKSITKLTPDEAAAIPKKFRP